MTMKIVLASAFILLSLPSICAQYNYQVAGFSADQVVCEPSTGKLTKKPTYIAPIAITVSTFSNGSCQLAIGSDNKKCIINSNGQVVNVESCVDGPLNTDIQPIGDFFENLKFVNILLTTSLNCSYESVGHGQQSKASYNYMPLKGTTTGPFKFADTFHSVSCVNGRVGGMAKCRDWSMTENCISVKDQCFTLFTGVRFQATCPLQSFRNSNSSTHAVEFSFPVAVDKVATVGENVFAAGNVSLIRQWRNNDETNYNDLIGILHYRFKYEPKSLTTSQNGHWLFVAAYTSNEIFQYKIGDEKSAQTEFSAPFSNWERITAMAQSGDYLFTTHQDGSVQQWSISKESWLRVIGNHSSPIATALVANTDYVYSVGRDGFVRQWIVANGTAGRVFSAYYLANGPGVDYPFNDVWVYTGPYENCAYYCDEFARKGCTAYILNLDDANGNGCWLKSSLGETVWRNLNRRATYVRIKILLAVAIAGDFVYASTDERNFNIHKWRVSTGKQVAVLSGHTDAINCLVAHGEYLFSGSSDGLIKVWHVVTNQWLANFTGHVAAVNSLAVNDHFLISGSSDKSVKLWIIGSGEKFDEIKPAGGFEIAAVVIGSLLGVVLIAGMSVILYKHRRSFVNYRGNAVPVGQHPNAITGSTAQLNHQNGSDALLNYNSMNDLSLPPSSQPRPLASYAGPQLPPLIKARSMGNVGGKTPQLCAPKPLEVNPATVYGSNGCLVDENSGARSAVPVAAVREASAASGISRSQISLAGVKFGSNNQLQQTPPPQQTVSRPSKAIEYSDYY